VSPPPSVALVTGATGLVGFHIVERLIADGWIVRALARSPDRARAALPAAVEIVAGDVLDGASFVRAALGSHVVFHAAATVTARGGWDAYRITNVEGTRNAIAAAEGAGARLLHVSSVAVYGPRARYDALRRGNRTTEATVLAPLSERSFYARSKRESEALALRAHAEGRIWAAAIRPAVVYGRRDRQFVPRMARVVHGAFIPLLRGGRTTMPVVHAVNVAQGAVLAATTDIAGGKAYNLANDYDVSVRAFFELAGQGLGREPRFVPMPLWAARGATRLVIWISRVLTRGTFSLLSSSTVDFISEENPFSSALAKRELGWSPLVRPEIAVPDAFRWWRAEREKTRTGATASRPSVMSDV
jgi:nucleoside-diphosphate-sugar epimerase